MSNKQIFAMHLPQYHECKFNNKWWGKGFTEWTNVYEAQPMFIGHKQPKIPLLGRYDLGLKKEIESQFKLASKYKIDGFIYYSYWYEGKRPLGTPLDIISNNKDLIVKYALCWANHPWTRSWTNRSGAFDVLIEQTYPKSVSGYNDYFLYLKKHFFDDRYIKIDGKPYYMIYSPSTIPKLEEFIFKLREYFKNINNTEIYIVASYTTTNSTIHNLDIFDSISLNQPALSFWSPENVFETKISLKLDSLNSLIRNLPLRLRRVLYAIRDKLPNRITIWDYDSVWSKAINQYEISLLQKKHNIIPMAFVDFDNTARYKDRAIIIKGFSVEKFEMYLKKLFLLAKDRSDIVLINAWNEWGEGMYLEPDQENEYAVLDSLSNVIDK
ncbi:glycoside hydrolase family 99-like domain-containing protein [Candidatus Thioglobus sp.]|nr:glycoside hydrolase family 99-like domain-containing protein [Candidatus Thioglobus sp.]